MPWRCSKVRMKGGASLRRPSPRASRTRETGRASHDGGTGIPSASRAVARRELIAPPSQPASGAGDFPELVGLDDVALLEVLEIAEADAAFEALLHLAGVVLEPLERGDRAVPDDDAVAQEPDPGAARDPTDAAVHERQPHLLVLLVDLAQSLGHGLERALHVRLEDEVERGDLAPLHHGEDVLEAGAAGERHRVREAGGAAPAGARLGDRARRLLVGCDAQLVSRQGDIVETEHLDRHGWAGVGHLLAVL